MTAMPKSTAAVYHMHDEAIERNVDHCICFCFCFFSLVSSVLVARCSIRANDNKRISIFVANVHFVQIRINIRNRKLSLLHVYSRTPNRNWFCNVHRWYGECGGASRLRLFSREQLTKWKKCFGAPTLSTAHANIAHLPHLHNNRHF